MPMDTLRCIKVSAVAVIRNQSLDISDWKLVMPRCLEHGLVLIYAGVGNHYRKARYRNRHSKADLFSGSFLVFYPLLTILI
jgi:hypothetical protein